MYINTTLRFTNTNVSVKQTSTQFVEDLYDQISS